MNFLLLLDIPRMRWDETQLIYHALGRLGVEALVLTRTVEPYVCVGFSQGVPAEVDTGYCRRSGIGVFRREIGGGTVFIDRNQLLVQLVLRRDNRAVPAGQSNFFRKFLGPLIGVYRELGLEAELRPPCDILVKGRKISGTGGGEVGECAVLATNVLVDFDAERAAEVLRCPGAEFREALRGAMKRNITTLRAELGTPPPWPELRRLVRKSYEELLGPLKQRPRTPGGSGMEWERCPGGGRGGRRRPEGAGGRGALRDAVGGHPASGGADGEWRAGAPRGPLMGTIGDEMERVRRELLSRKWLGDPGARRRFREVKVRELN